MEFLQLTLVICKRALADCITVFSCSHVFVVAWLYMYAFHFNRNGLINHAKQSILYWAGVLHNNGSNPKEIVSLLLKIYGLRFKTNTNLPG